MNQRVAGSAAARPTCGSLVWAAAGAICVLCSAPSPAQTPEETRAWEAQRAQARADEQLKAERLAREREGRRADPMAWVRTLDTMSAGGWVFRAVATDGSWAAFTTDHQLKRSGRTVTVWQRQEYPEPQRGADGDVYWSDVEKLQIDCAKDQSRVLLIIYYSQNNLTGTRRSEEADPKTAPWDPVVPGTQSEIVFNWACAPGAR